ncbi:MAG: ABC transporter substrate-binding protein, partial [Candidatus Electrothrix sp. AR4]|nr:ABC transporter substrate-binding protein [Candidatus Electrothrix sp. AR4]
MQPQFDRKNARAVAQAVGGKLAELDPLAKDPTRNL